MARLNGKDRGLFQRNGVWWVRWVCPYGHEHREKGGSKSLARQLYERRKTAVRHEGFCLDSVRGYQSNPYTSQREPQIRNGGDIRRANVNEWGLSISFDEIKPHTDEAPINLGYECVYFLIKSREVVYVGQSVDGISRIYNHIKNLRLGRTSMEFDEAYMLPVPRQRLIEMERAFIHLFRPVYNKNCMDSDLDGIDKLCLQQFFPQKNK